MTRHIRADAIRAVVHKFDYRPADGALLWKKGYGPRHKSVDMAGSLDSHGYLQVHTEGKCIFVHRIVWAMFNATDPEQIDHINRIRTDNRVENLRPATNSTNQHNAKTRKDNSTGHRGITAHHGKFQVRISVDGIRHHVGCFDTFEEAVSAYNKTKENLYGTEA